MDNPNPSQPVKTPSTPTIPPSPETSSNTPTTPARKSSSNTLFMIVMGVLLLGLGILLGYLIWGTKTSTEAPMTEQKSVDNNVSPSPIATSSGKVATYVLPEWTIVAPKSSTSSSSAEDNLSKFEDKNIDSVSTDAQDLLSDSDFPKGFFSSDPRSWGINYSKKGPITVDIVFTKPVMLSTISNSFSGCQGAITNNQDCLVWDVRGLTTDNKTESLIAKAAGNLRKGINSTSLFTQIQITVENIQVPQGEWKSSIQWQKIKLEYK
jgi:hypothetical protein